MSKVNCSLAMQIHKFILFLVAIASSHGDQNLGYLIFTGEKATNDACDFVASMHLGPAYIPGTSRCVGDVCSFIFWSDASRNLLTTFPHWGSVHVTCSDAHFDAILLEVNRMHSPQAVKPDYNFSPVVAPSVYMPRHQNGYVIGTHYLDTLVDARPRVIVRFTQTADLNPDGFSMMLDTGSSKTFVRTRSKACRRDAGFITGGRSRPVNQKLTYGVDELHFDLKLTKEIPEEAIIGNSVRLALQLGIAEVCSNPHVGTGMLGAGRSSELVRSMGIFGFKGPAVRYKYTNKNQSAGSLLIGISDWSAHCKSPFVYARTLQTRSPHHWTVDGTFSIPAQSFTTRRLNWIIDTGGPQTMLSFDAYMALVNAIQHTGASFEKVEQNHKNLIFGCLERWKSFPTVRISIPTMSGEELDTDLTPADYLSYSDRHTGNCRLSIVYSQMKNFPDTSILGVDFLQKRLTTFDHTHNQVGFCTPMY
jgi:hypothetical protein